MNTIQKEDYQQISTLPFIEWERLAGKTVLITGGTGLIGSNLVNALLYIDNVKKLGLKVILPVRNPEKAKKVIDTGSDALLIKPYALGERIEVQASIDYVVHLASPTSSKFFAEQPADTLLANIEGTKSVLELAREKKLRKFVYLSSMEVYGFPRRGHQVTEKEIGAFETMHARNSYPIAKIASEALCNAYWVQYQVPVVVLRATQTFGPGVEYNDGRVFAEFMRCVLEKKNIVLKSAGLTERSYLYTGDAVTAILTGLLNGNPGESYTVANPETYCSIKDMAQLVADRIAHGDIEVVYNISEDIEKAGYAPTLYMDLDVSKIKSLGWRPTRNLTDMFERMIQGATEDLPSK